MNRPLSSILIAMTILLFTPLTHGAVYKWQDKQGVTHFSDAPPASGQYESIEQPRLSPADPGAERQLNELLQSQKQGEEDQLKKEQKQKKTAEEEAARAETCHRARERLAVLESRPGSRIKITDPDGTQRRLTEEEYQSSLAEVRKRIADSCDE